MYIFNICVYCSTSAVLGVSTSAVLWLSTSAVLQHPSNPTNTLFFFFLFASCRFVPSLYLLCTGLY